MIINEIFPTPIGAVSLEKPLTEQERSFLLNQEQVENTGNMSSLDTYILDRPGMENLKSFIEQNLKKYFEITYNVQDNVEIYLTQSWTNYTSPSQYHHKHSHWNSIVSGVLYVDVDAQNDKIHFYKNNAENQLGFSPKEWNAYNSLSWFVPIENNLLVFFPSALVHSVEPTINNKNVRVSLAFNSFVRGTLGTDRSMTELHLR
jgi:uncharacterized protein (TIGR02466 family)